MRLCTSHWIATYGAGAAAWDDWVGSSSCPLCGGVLQSYRSCNSGGVGIRLSRGRFQTDGRTDGRTIGRWPRGRPWLGRTVASFLKLPGGKTAASAQTRACVRADACPRTRGRERVQAMDAKGLYKGFRVIPFSLPSLPWPREATVCLVHFVVWAAIGGSFLGHTCRCSADPVFIYSAFWRLFQGCCYLDYNDEDPC
jgi:hypothetical protein